MKIAVVELSAAILALASLSEAFNSHSSLPRSRQQQQQQQQSHHHHHQLSAQANDELAIQKERLFKLLGTQPVTDSVLADPITKEAIQISAAPGVLLGGDAGRGVKYTVTSPSNKFKGSSDSFIDLLQPATNDDDETSSGSSSSSSSPLNEIWKQAQPYIPVPLRAPLASVLPEGEYIPMVSFFCCFFYCPR